MIVYEYTIYFSLMDSLYTAGNKPLEKYIGALGYAHPGRFMDLVAYLLLQCCVRRTLVCVLQLTASFLVITTGDSYSAKVKALYYVNGASPFYTPRYHTIKLGISAICLRQISCFFY